MPHVQCCIIQNKSCDVKLAGPLKIDHLCKSTTMADFELCHAGSTVDPALSVELFSTAFHAAWLSWHIAQRHCNIASYLNRSGASQLSRQAVCSQQHSTGFQHTLFLHKWEPPSIQPCSPLRVHRSIFSVHFYYVWPSTAPHLHRPPLRSQTALPLFMAYSTNERSAYSPHAPIQRAC